MTAEHTCSTDLVEAFNRGSCISVRKNKDLYEVLVNSEVRHPECSAEDVIRALAHYLQDNSTRSTALCPHCSRFVHLDTEARFIPHRRSFSSIEYCGGSVQPRNEEIR